MAVSQIEERILGRLARQTERHAPLLASSFYEVLGLSIMLSRRLIKARRTRRLDTTRDTKSLELYYRIIWLAREGLSITEVQILRDIQQGDPGSECRVMAAKLRASLYHVICLYHNHPPITQLMMLPSGSEHPAAPSGRDPDVSTKEPLERLPGSIGEGDEGGTRRRPGKAAFRDPIPSVVSDASYVTNPFSPNEGHSSPPPSSNLQPLFQPPTSDARRTPTHPPGLPTPNLSSSQAAASFLLPTTNFVPIAREAFAIAQDLAEDLLRPTHALRLSLTLEHCSFLWECVKSSRAARHLARNAVRAVYASTEGLSDEEYMNAAALVQALGGILSRDSAARQRERDIAPAGREAPAPDSGMSVPPGTALTSQDTRYTAQSRVPQPVPQTARSAAPPIDRTIVVSPSDYRNQIPPPFEAAQPSPPQQEQEPMGYGQQQMGPIFWPPPRLTTIIEVPSTSSASFGGSGRGAREGGAQRSATASAYTLSPPPTIPGGGPRGEDNGNGSPSNHSRSRSCSRSRPRNRQTSASSAGTAGNGGSTDKATKRRAIEKAQEDARRRRGNGSGTGSRPVNASSPGNPASISVENAARSVSSPTAGREGASAGSARTLVGQREGSMGGAGSVGTDLAKRPRRRERN